MPDWLEILTTVVPIVLSIGAIIYAFFANRRKDVDDRFDKFDKRIGGLERAVESLGQKIEHMPDQRSVHQIMIQLQKMDGDIRVLTETVGGQAEIMTRLEHMVGRHEDTLLKRE